MRSENPVSDIVLKGLLAVFGVFVLENGGNRSKNDNAFAHSGRTIPTTFAQGVALS